MRVEPIKLKSLIETSGLKYKQTSRSWYFRCPRCAKKDKLYISKGNGRFVCFYCREIDGFQGKPEFALCELLGEPIAVIRERLYGTAIIDGSTHLDIDLRDFFGDGDELDEDADMFSTMHFPFDYYPIDTPKLAEKGALYLEGRGVPLDIAKQYNIRYCPTRRRVVFPVEYGGRVVGWQERLVIADRKVDEKTGEVIYEAPRLLSSKEIPRDNTLMFSDRLLGVNHAVLCEGPVDALKAHLCGGNVATMGKVVTEAQLNLLRNAGIKKLYVALDPDAWAEASAVVRRMGDLECYLMRPSPGYKDLGEMSMAQVYDTFKSAVRVTPAHILVVLKDL